MTAEAALLSLGRHVAAKLAQDAGKRIATALPRARGEWRGPLSAKSEKRGWRVSNEDPCDACRLFVSAAGIEYAFGDGFWSDGGSIPEVCQWAKHLRLKPDSFPRSYFLHDWAYARASVFALAPGVSTWVALRITRLEADTLLYCGLVAEGATALEARTIFRAVRLFGNRAWTQHRKDAP